MESLTIVSHVALESEVAGVASKSAARTPRDFFLTHDHSSVSLQKSRPQLFASSHTAYSQEWVSRRRHCDKWELTPMRWGLHRNKWYCNEHPSKCPEDKTNVNLTLIQHRCRSTSPAAESELCESWWLRGTLLGSLYETPFVSVSSAGAQKQSSHPVYTKKSIRSSVISKHGLRCCAWTTISNDF